jgi:hypothetical protein
VAQLVWHLAEFNMISESLRSNDLRHFVKSVFEIDTYRSKIGDDQDVVTLSFTVAHEAPAKDLENFIEMGYDFVLDADVSPGETDDNTYKVFVELERGRHAAEQISQLVSGIEKLTGEPGLRFRYFKNFKSEKATEENLEKMIPMDPDAYKTATERHNLNNFQEFFVNSYADEIKLLDESISFKRVYGDTVTFNVVTSGTKQDVYNSVQGPIMLENKDIGEVLFLSKYIGNYNITKIGNIFIFENNGWAVALEKK